jgi:hypothetical protein
MAVAFVQEFRINSDDRSTTNYDAIAEQLDLDGDKPAGLIVHTAGWDEEGHVFRIFDVWESREHGERFMRERLQPLLEQGPANPENSAMPDREGMYELHDVYQP